MSSYNETVWTGICPHDTVSNTLMHKTRWYVWWCMRRIINICMSHISVTTDTAWASGVYVPVSKFIWWIKVVLQCEPPVFKKYWMMNCGVLSPKAEMLYLGSKLQLWATRTASAFQQPTLQQLQRTAVASRGWVLLPPLTVLEADNTQPGPVMTTWTQHALKKASWRYVPNCSFCPVKFGLVPSSPVLLELKVSEARQTKSFILV